MPKNTSLQKVIQYLREHKVEQASVLAQHFSCSKKTIFRALTQTGYLTSYNQNNSGLTLPDIPTFDKNGCWECRGFRFSKWGSLKQTIQQVVKNSEAGLVAGEIQQLLQHTNLYHHITRCVEEGLIVREKQWRYPLYFSTDAQERQKQLKARERMIQHQRPPLESTHLSAEKIIQVLVVALKHHATSTKKIMPLLESEGVRVGERGVKWIFEHYQIEKKGSP